jgi:hypothetical protein
MAPAAHLPNDSRLPTVITEGPGAAAVQGGCRDSAVQVRAESALKPP